MVGCKDTISQASQLLFKWHLELSGEQTKTAERHIRADNAFAIGRGVQLPGEWLELCAPLPAAATAGRFTAMAAHEAAKDASTGASLKLGDVCTAVDCRSASPSPDPHSLVSVLVGSAVAYVLSISSTVMRARDRGMSELTAPKGR